VGVKPKRSQLLLTLAGDVVVVEGAGGRAKHIPKPVPVLPKPAAQKNPDTTEAPAKRRKTKEMGLED